MTGGEGECVHSHSPDRRLWSIVRRLQPNHLGTRDLQYYAPQQVPAKVLGVAMCVLSQEGGHGSAA